MSNSPKMGLKKWDVGRFTSLIISPNWPQRRGAPRVDREANATEIGRSGILALRNVVSPELCDQVVRDYTDYENVCLTEGVKIRDPGGRNYRLTNFHLASKAALDIACKSEIHNALDAYFGMRSMVYTSLFFKHGSQQSTHVDTPFFVSDPVGWFAGVWVALEDVHPAAGPLEYYLGAHRLFDTEEKLRALNTADSTLTDVFTRVKAAAEKVATPSVALLNKGDVLIWHHGLPHGGRLATDARLTRYSMVFHMTAEGVNIRTEGLFREAQRLEFPRYGRFRHHGRLVARVGLPRIMI